MKRWVFLSGMMGSGKSTVARVLAERAGMRWVDLDERVAERAGRTISQIFRELGEAAFRVLEAEEVRLLIEHEEPSIVALGGGTVTNRTTRRGLLRSGTLVTLQAPVEELARRLDRAQDRPLLSGGAALDRLRTLREQRAADYAECHAVVETGGRTPDSIAAEVADVVRTAPLLVPLGVRTYRIEIGRGNLASLGDALGEGEGGAVVLVTDRNVEEPWAARVVESARGAGRAVVPVTLEPGEIHKTSSAVEAIWDAALDAGIDRDAMVLAVGGGVVGDLAGFAASTLLRGIAFAQVPTSLLAMVDASVGGKTGFDRPQGKNLVGTFHQPRFVRCDIETLSTLPDEELRSGLAEVVKAAWIDDEASVARLERDADALLARDPDATERAIRMAVRIKADVVMDDEHEEGRRRVLNLGHTLGHAIEAARGYQGVRHGEAVALGMMAAFRVAESLGDPDSARHAERMGALLARLGLPVDVDAHLDPQTLERLGADKKRSGSDVRFIVPAAPGQVDVVRIGLDEVRRAISRR